MAKNIEKGVFRSEWSDGSVIETPATLNLKTGELTVKNSNDDSDHGNLVSEEFENEDGDTYDVCDCCHEYVMKSVMVDGIGHCVDEDFVCSNKHCDSNFY